MVTVSYKIGFFYLKFATSISGLFWYVNITTFSLLEFPRVHTNNTLERERGGVSLCTRYLLHIVIDGRVVFSCPDVLISEHGHG